MRSLIKVSPKETQRYSTKELMTVGQMHLVEQRRTFGQKSSMTSTVMLKSVNHIPTSRHGRKGSTALLQYQESHRPGTLWTRKLYHVVARTELSNQMLGCCSACIVGGRGARNTTNDQVNNSPRTTCRYWFYHYSTNVPWHVRTHGHIFSRVRTPRIYTATLQTTGGLRMYPEFPRTIMP